MTTYSKISLFCFSALCAFYTPLAFALPEVVVEIKEHLFFPQEVIVPAGQKVKLTFVNFDDTPEEIDSFSLNREKVIFAKSRGTIFIGPLKAGEYPFFGEFHPNSAVGKVVVKSKEDTLGLEPFPEVTCNARASGVPNCTVKPTIDAASRPSYMIAASDWLMSVAPVIVGQFNVAE